jgi:GAF domain-containing protein
MGTDMNFSELAASVARELSGEPDVEHTLQRAVDLAAQHLDGETYVSVSLVLKRRRVETPASSDSRAARADALQYELEEGPCLDAIFEHETFRIVDMLTDEAYPRWSRRVAEETGIRSSLSFQLFVTRDSLGALNVYSAGPDAFSDDDRAEGQVFAAQAAVALQAAQTEEQLRSAIVGRTVIGQAQGIMMERFKIDSDKAFRVLTRLSQTQNIKLSEAARRLVDTGQLPQH